MTALVIGLVMFMSMHSVRIVADGFRTRQIEKLGLKTWRAMYAAVSLLAVVLIVTGYGVARATSPIVWSSPVWAIHLAILLTIPAFVLMAASFVSGSRIRRKVGHPLLLGVKIWALAHLLANGSVADVLLFGAFLIWSVVAYASARRRDRKAGTVYVAGPPSRDVIAVIAGLVAWIVFALWLHRWLIGVAPLQMMAGA